ncbi:MAG: type II toxin-antitoxin system HicA family toxin [Anaerolineales bacterium]|nr:type II toxin-antitoxin system HicA family toxin [Anaerolineales bacterium]
MKKIASFAIISIMNKRQQKTLEAIFNKPVPASLEWDKIESLFLAVGANQIKGRGSRIQFELNGIVATFHRPHPNKEAKPYQIRDARRFLEQAGIKP